MWVVQSRYLESDFYPSLEKELRSLIMGEKNLIANLANISSWLNATIPDLNWCGFYLWDETDQELVLGPFQGRPACLRIRPGRGVCGTAFSEVRSIKVDDVHEFPGHIACDSASLSELVIPLVKQSQVKGVLDLDSPVKNRFTERDLNELTLIMNHLVPLIF
jgi:L-methionine (R)-S-oxide reductase